MSYTHPGWIKIPTLTVFSEGSPSGTCVFYIEVRKKQNGGAVYFFANEMTLLFNVW